MAAGSGSAASWTSLEPLSNLPGSFCEACFVRCVLITIAGPGGDVLQAHAKVAGRWVLVHELEFQAVILCFHKHQAGAVTVLLNSGELHTCLVGPSGELGPPLITGKFLDHRTHHGAVTTCTALDSGDTVVSTGPSVRVYGAAGGEKGELALKQRLIAPGSGAMERRLLPLVGGQLLCISQGLLCSLWGPSTTCQGLLVERSRWHSKHQASRPAAAVLQGGEQTLVALGGSVLQVWREAPGCWQPVWSGGCHATAAYIDQIIALPRMGFLCLYSDCSISQWRRVGARWDAFAFLPQQHAAKFEAKAKPGCTQPAAKVVMGPSGRAILLAHGCLLEFPVGGFGRRAAALYHRIFTRARRPCK